MTRSAYISPVNNQRIVKRWNQAKDDDRDYTFYWNDFAVSEGTTVSSVAYTTRAGNLTAASNTVTSGVAKIKLTFSSTGKKLVKMIATMADSSTHTKNFVINVYDPDELLLEDRGDIWGVP